MWFWFGAAALFLLLELGTGTFYLLLVSLGMMASGTAAYAGLSFIWQIVCGLLVSLVGLAVLHRFRRSRGYVPTQSNTNVVQDVGQHVMVDAWNESGQANVFYRGTNWSARLDADQAAQPGEHYIHSVQGLTLVLRPGRYPGTDAQH